MSLLRATFGDAQTTITSLAAGVGGTASTKLGDYIITAAGGNNGDGGVGALGLQFCGRAVISAAIFSALSAQMPETSGNVFFSILYFFCDTGLMNSARQLSIAAITAITPKGGALSMARSSAYVPPAQNFSKPSNCGSCK